MIKIKYIDTLLGEMILGSYDDKICLCDWKHRKARARVDKRLQTFFKCEYDEVDCEVLSELEKQIKEFLAGKREKFSLSYLTVGTSFQKNVWEELNKIPFSQTISYKELAEKNGDSKAFRAVANANGTNALSLIIPCHRVVATGGGLGGYAGGLEAKKFLLELETRK